MNYYVGDFPPNDYFNTPRGWVCPKCGRVYSPNTSMCYFCCSHDTTTINATTPQDTTGSTPYKFPTTVTTTATIPIHDEISSFFDKLIDNLKE